MPSYRTSDPTARSPWEVLAAELGRIHRQTEDHRATFAARINPTVWEPATLAGSWAAVVGTATPAYRLEQAGNVVRFRGAVNAGTGTIFTLPTGYRPAAGVRLATVGDAAAARIDVSTAGVVSLAQGAATASLALDGLTFARS